MMKRFPFLCFLAIALLYLPAIPLLAQNASMPPPVFSCSPTSLDFGSVDNGKSKVDSVVVTNTGTSNLTIISITIDSAVFSITPKTATIAASGSRTFYITFAPIWPGAKLAHIVFRQTTLRDTITAQGTGIGPAYVPSFSMTPLSLNFGDVTNGSQKTDSVVVTNAGIAPLRITNVTSTLTVFNGTPKVDTIAPSASAVFHVTFSPITAGSYAGKLFFSHNAAGGKDSMNVDGNGTGPTAEPQFSVAPASLDFGDVATGTSKTDSVIVTNTGTLSLSISNTSSSSARFTVTPRNATIAPAGSRMFYITFTPTTAGVVQAKIFFPHNAKGGRDSIEVSGNGTGASLAPKFSVNPASLAFGTVQNGTTKGDSVFVTNTGTANLTISTATSSNTSFTVSPGGLVTIAPAASRKFTITFAPTTDGDKNGFIRFQHNAATAKDSIPVTGTGTGGAIAPVFSINPTSLAYGTVQNGTTKADSVFVTNTGTANLTIASATSSNTSFTVTPGGFVTIAPAGSRKFTITFAPTTDGDKTGFIRFQHNAATAKDSIPVSGTGTGGSVAPKFTVAPASLSFGSVQNGTTEVDSVFVTNTGTANLTITSATSSNTSYTVTPGFATIAPAASRKFTITFAPMTDGDKLGFIRFLHNAANAKDSIPVSGTGTGGSVEPIFAVSPTTLNFDTVSTGMSRADSVTVHNTGKSPLIISNISSNNTHFTITPRNFTVQPGATRSVVITYAPLSPVEDTARILFTHNAGGTRDSIMVYGKGVGATLAAVFNVTPKHLDFGTIQFNTTKADSVVVTNTGNMTLTIIQTATTAPFSILPRNASIPPNESRVFTITFAPTTEGSFASRVVFTHNGTSVRDTVTLSGIADSGSEDPIFKATPTTLNLGGVPVSVPKIDSIIVRNTGRNALTVFSIAVDNPVFTIFPPTGNIGPSQTKTFFVTFTPTDTGAVSARIIFTDNAPTQHDTVVTTGRGLKVISIKDARAAAVGTDVAFEGIVTRTEGTYTRLQDQTGGMAVRQTSGVLFTAIADGEVMNGDRIQVYGRVSELQSLRVITGADFSGYQRISRGNPLPAPVKLTLAEIAQNGESYESQLVTVSGLTINGGTDTSFRAAKSYPIRDASDTSNAVVLRIPAATDSDVDGLTFFGTNVTFTGVLGQSSPVATNGYQLIPVLPTDLHQGATAVGDVPTDAHAFLLSATYPNPVSLSTGMPTTIRYNLPEAGTITLKVYSVMGAEIATLFDGYQDSGLHQVVWNLRNTLGLPLSGGVYFYELRASSTSGQLRFRNMRSMVIIP